MPSTVLADLIYWIETHVNMHPHTHSISKGVGGYFCGPKRYSEIEALEICGTVEAGGWLCAYCGGWSCPAHTCVDIEGTLAVCYQYHSVRLTPASSTIRLVWYGSVSFNGWLFPSRHGLLLVIFLDLDFKQIMLTSLWRNLTWSPGSENGQRAKDERPIRARDRLAGHLAWLTPLVACWIGRTFHDYR